MRSGFLATLWALLAGCPPGVPEVCEEMCAAAVPAQAACLARDGLTFGDVPGWGDEAGFYAACEAWAWQTVRLERDARWRGELRGGGHTRAACESRADRLIDEGCAAWEAYDWDTSPWE
jgi:hypothetical protein